MGFLYVTDISGLDLGLVVAGATLCLVAYALRLAYHVVRFTRGREIVSFRFSVIVITLGYLGWGYWSAADPVKMAVPRAVALGAGIPLTAAGLALFVLSEIRHRGAGRYEGLITNGIYSRVRHPMYVGLVLLHYGYPLIYRSFVAFLSTHLSTSFSLNRKNLPILTYGIYP